MPTLLDLIARIGDDLDRIDLNNQITAAITDAIKHYESHRFIFNEAYNISGTLSSSVGSIALTSLAFYPAKIDRIRVKYSGAQNYTELLPRDVDWLMDGQDIKAVCHPLEYCVYAEALQLDSRPDQNYTYIMDGVRRLSTGSTASFTVSSSLSWFNEGRLLIRARAKVDLYTHVIRDFEQAQAMAAIEQREYRTLKQALNTRNSGRVRPTEF